MPLSLSLHSVSMTFECPFCTCTLVRLTYSDKVALFYKHAQLERKSSN